MTANITNFTDMIYANINDPNCAFSTGAMVGGFWLLKFLFLILCLYVIIRFLDKLAFEPLLEKAKKILWKKKKR